MTPEQSPVPIIRSIVRAAERLGRLEHLANRMSEIYSANGETLEAERWKCTLFTMRDQISLLRMLDGVPDGAMTDAIRRGYEAGQIDFEAIRRGMDLRYPDE